MKGTMRGVLVVLGLFASFVYLACTSDFTQAPFNSTVQCSDTFAVDADSSGFGTGVVTVTVLTPDGVPSPTTTVTASLNSSAFSTFLDAINFQPLVQCNPGGTPAGVPCNGLTTQSDDFGLIKLGLQCAPPDCTATFDIGFKQCTTTMTVDAGT